MPLIPRYMPEITNCYSSEIGKPRLCTSAMSLNLITLVKEHRAGLVIIKFMLDCIYQQSGMPSNVLDSSTISEVILVDFLTHGRGRTILTLVNSNQYVDLRFDKMTISSFACSGSYSKAPFS